MERLREHAPLLITAVLSLLLLAYVFAGGSRDDKPAAQGRCSSRETYESIKADLFRQAAALRKSSDPAFSRLAQYSVVRADSKVLRDADERSGTVTCTGAIALDLPPGVEVIGGRRSLSGKVRYVLAGERNRAPQLRSLSNADSITVPLATVATSGSASGQQLAPPPVQPDPAEMNSAEAQPATTGPEAQPASAKSFGSPVRSVPAPRVAERRGAQLQTPLQRRPVAPAPVKKPVAKRTTTVAAAPKPPPALRVAQPAIAAAVTPSFNCRYARTYGEVAVCRNPDLASLDRRMATQFYRASSSASRGARVMLRRSRDRFLKSRDSCRSDACVADAYRRRIGEIDSIMAGGF